MRSFFVRDGETSPSGEIGLAFSDRTLYNSNHSGVFRINGKRRVKIKK